MTFHIAHNFGAMLQAYALVTKINGLGFNCEILDYRFAYIDRWSGIRNRSDLSKEYGFLLGNLRFVKRYLKGEYRSIKPMRKKFDNFMRKDILLSSEVYFTADELAYADYDVIVFGSDQIWNTDLTNGIAFEYLGKHFDNSITRLISYAASCGKDSLKPEWKNDFLPLLQRFQSLGIREKAFADFLCDEYGLPAQTVLDPVFLLEKAEWEQMVSNINVSDNGPYLLVYAFQTEDDIYHLARKIATERGLKLVVISYKKEDKLNDMLQLTDAGPKDFVALIHNADFICTSSFHGMAFAILFEKNFYCMGHPLYSQRNIDLLNMIGMRDRLFTKETEIKKIDDCNYTHAREKLIALKKHSLKFLKEAIRG